MYPKYVAYTRMKNHNLHFVQLDDSKANIILQKNALIYTEL